MEIANGEIVLNINNGIYYPGQKIFGKLILYQNSTTTFRGIYVTFRGSCYVQFVELFGQSHDVFESSEDYFNQKRYLIGSETGQRITLHPGQYEYLFFFTMPPECPSSFESKYGHVRYSIEAVFDYGYKSTRIAETAIKVVAPLDCSLLPKIKKPVKIKFGNVGFYWCTWAESVRATLELPFSGFYPGQVVPVEVRGRNTVPVIMELAIAMVTTFRAKGFLFENTRFLIQEHEVTRFHLDAVQGSDTDNRFTAVLVIPQLDVVNMHRCRYINVDYQLKVKLISGCHGDLLQTRNIALDTFRTTPNFNGTSYPSNPSNIVHSPPNAATSSTGHSMAQFTHSAVPTLTSHSLDPFGAASAPRSPWTIM